jgi:gluconate 5-dehydrogenase
MSRSAAPLNDLRAQIEASGGSASVVAVDVSDAAAFGKAIEDVGTQHGRIDILVNNGGASPRTG